MSLVASRICNGLLGPIILQYTCPDKVHTTCSIVYICNLFVSHSCPCTPFTWKNSIHLIHLTLSEIKSKGQTVFSVLIGETFTASGQPYFGIYINLILKKQEKLNRTCIESSNTEAILIQIISTHSLLTFETTFPFNWQFLLHYSLWICQSELQLTLEAKVSIWKIRLQDGNHCLVWVTKFSSTCCLWKRNVEKLVTLLKIYQRNW